jgi:hypothetical protein
MHIKTALAAILLAGISSWACAQKQIVSQYHSWFLYTGNHRLTDKLGLHTEYQWRRASWVTSWQQSLLRLGVDYRLGEQATVTLGYAYIITWPYGEQPVNEKFTEHRLWQTLTLTQRQGRFYFNHRFRPEQRWLQGNGNGGTSHYTYRNRMRYRFLVNYPLNRKEMGPATWFASASDEIFIQFGPNFGRNYLDQNRLFAGIGYQFSAHGNVQAGYLQQFIVKSDGLKAERNHTLQLALFYNFDWR